jgi:O-antigen/teichoic acid export membrane protein
VFSLYAGQAAVWLVPFITVPYLARVLGVAEWGRYSVALSLSTQLALLVDYGFGITANRAVAQQRIQPTRMSTTIGAVIAAKLILAAVALSIAAMEYIRVPSFREAPALFWYSVSAGMLQGATFSWCLYGIEKIAAAVALDLGSRLLAAASVLLVTGPADAWRFFAVQTVVNLLALALGFAYVVRANGVGRPEPRAIASLLRHGFSAMLSRSGFGVYSGLNVFLLGLYASSDVVGQYAGAERIGRGITALSAPLCMAIFPRVNYLLAKDPAKVERLRALGGTATIIVGALASAATYVFAPTVTRMVLGPAYGDAAAILRVLSALPLLVAINQVLLYQYLFPEGAFDYVALSVAGTATLILCTAAILGWARSSTSMAAIADVSEGAAMIFLLSRQVRSRTSAGAA